MNLFPDPALTDTGYFNGAPSTITKSDGLISFNGATQFDAIGMDGAIESQFFDLIAVSGQYHVSVYGANVVPGTLMVKIGNGAWAYITLAADGWTDPVLVTAGSSRSVSFVLKGVSGTTLDIVPDENGEAIRITT